MASLSEKLRRERELRGISLKQISEDTKIGVRFLQALEEDKLELIPGEFYRRSYLRAYARYLGLDEDRAVNAYAFSNQEQKPGDADGADKGRDGGLTHAAVPAWLPWVVVVAVITVVAILLARTQSGSAPRSNEALSPAAPELARPAPTEPTTHAEQGETAAVGAKPETVAAAASDSSTSPRAAGAGTPIPAASSPTSSPMVPVLTPSREAPAVAGGSLGSTGLTGSTGSTGSTGPARKGALRLVVAVGEACWLEIEADGTVVTTGLKEEGFRQEFTADDEVRLWLGNAGGVSFWVNDRPLRSLGRAGQVRKDLSITRDNFMDYVTSEPGSS